MLWEWPKGDRDTKGADTVGKWHRRARSMQHWHDLPFVKHAVSAKHHKLKRHKVRGARVTFMSFNVVSRVLRLGRLSPQSIWGLFRRPKQETPYSLVVLPSLLKVFCFLLFFFFGAWPGGREAWHGIVWFLSCKSLKILAHCLLLGIVLGEKSVIIPLFRCLWCGFFFSPSCSLLDLLLFFRNLITTGLVGFCCVYATWDSSTFLDPRVKFSPN